MRIMYVEDESGTRFLASEKLAHLAELPPATLAEEVKNLFGLTANPKPEPEEEEKP